MGSPVGVWFSVESAAGRMGKRGLVSNFVGRKDQVHPPAGAVQLSLGLRKNLRVESDDLVVS